MIKITSLLLLCNIYLFGAGFWTLTGLEKANIYLINEVAHLDAKTVSTTKVKIAKMLHKIGIKTKQKDSPTLMISFKEVQNEDDHYVYVQLALGEEVQTFREDETATFALTYEVNDFIEVDSEELDDGVLESVDFLLSQFVEQFEDDKE
jgi:hypothetical protein